MESGRLRRWPTASLPRASGAGEAINLRDERQISYYVK